MNATRRAATVLLILALTTTGLATASAQPGIGGGGADVYGGAGGADKGSTVVVQGGYTPAPQTAAAPRSTGGNTAASTPSNGTTAGASTEPAPAFWNTDNGQVGVSTQNQLDACAGLSLNCVIPSPDIGMPATPEIVDVATVVQMATTAIQVLPPPMCMTPYNGEPPPPGITGLVGLWSWMWMCEDQINESTVGPVTRVASVGAVTVTATAVHTGIVLNPGTGAPPVYCPPGPQIPYADVFVDLPSPSGCSFHLTKSSQLEPGGTFKPSATSLWTITWTATTPAGVQGGVIPQALTSRTEIRVGEMQVLVHN